MVPPDDLPTRARIAGGRPGLLRAGAIALVVLTACGNDGGEGFETLMSTAVCEGDPATFTTDIDNPFFPLPVGHRVVLEGDEGGAALLVRITALDETETVAGVETRVVEEFESKDGVVVEVSRNFFAQADDGTVCYFGEDVDIFDADGDVTSHSGEWRAGEAENRPGIFMPPTLEVGQAFAQEIAPGIAEDQARVTALGEPTETPAGTFEDTATLLDRNPLDGGQGEKVYARGIGLIVDGPTRLTSTSATPA